MSEYKATISWHRKEEEDFVQSAYSRGHEWSFDGGAVVLASASPNVVPLPYSVEANVDPEEAFVASLSSCHMLMFLSIAAKEEFIVDSYIDNAVGRIELDTNGKLSITNVRLRPEVVFSGKRQPAIEQIKEMHHRSHEQCFIANSVKTEVATEISD